MAEDRIKLGLDTGDSAQQAQSLASNLNKVRDAAQGVADTYEVVAQAEAKTGKGSFFEALGKADAGLAPLQEMTRRTTEFQDSLSRLDGVLKRVDDAETVFVTTAEDVAEAQRKQAAAAEKAAKAEMAQAIAVAYYSATMQQEQEDAARAAQGASDKIVASAVRQTQAQSAMRDVLEDIPLTFQRTTGVIKQAGDAADATGKKTGGLGRAMLAGSYAAQDFTSQIGTTGLAGALNAVQNNIPGILSGLGAGAGLAGVVSVVAVGAGLLYTNWDKLDQLWTTTTPKLPVLKEGLDGLTESLTGINKEIATLSEKSLTDVLSHPEQNRLGALEALKTEAENRQNDLKLVEGIAAIQSDRTKALVESVKKAIGEAGGGAAVAQNLKENTGGTYQDAAAVVAQAVRGDRDALKNLQANAPTFGKRLQDNADAEKAKEDQKAKEIADKEKEKAAKEADRQAKAEQDRQDAVLGQFWDAQGKAQVDDLASGMERAANGGFTSAETQQLAASNQATFRADRGQASPDELQRIISQNDAMMRSLGDAGGDGSAMMSSFMQVQTQLLWALGRIQQQEAQSNQWRQMQAVNGTLLSRGGG